MRGWVLLGIFGFLAWRFSRQNPVINGSPVNLISGLPYMLGFRSIAAIPQAQIAGGANTSAGPSIDPTGMGIGIGVTYDKL
jgi:hypothetical protein